ncbi:hypothetical protein VCRA2113O351_70037 [Vibrio crassostreae]|nr:hypothetical protein VCRA2113O351_70037 [Vibrio crassostreae]
MAKEVKKFTTKELGRHYGNAMENSLQRNEAEGEIKRRELRNSNIQTWAVVITCILGLATFVASQIIK